MPSTTPDKSKQQEPGIWSIREQQESSTMTHWASSSFRPLAIKEELFTAVGAGLAASSSVRNWAEVLPGQKSDHRFVTLQKISLPRGIFKLKISMASGLVCLSLWAASSCRTHSLTIVGSAEAFSESNAVALSFAEVTAFGNLWHKQSTWGLLAKCVDECRKACLTYPNDLLPIGVIHMVIKGLLPVSRCLPSGDGAADVQH